MTLNPAVLEYARRSGEAAGQMYIELGVLPPCRLKGDALAEAADAWWAAAWSVVADEIGAWPDACTVTFGDRADGANSTRSGLNT